MTIRNNQSGSAHLIITLIISVALIGALGYIFWQKYTDINQEKSKKADSAAVEEKNVSTEEAYKTYATSKYGISFKYPSTWSISEEKGPDDEAFYQRTVSVKDSNNSIVANFGVGLQIGGACGNTFQYNTIEVEKTTLATRENSGSYAFYSVSVLDNADGTKGLIYGLTNRYISLGTGQVCPNTFYYTIAPDISGINGLMFANRDLQQLTDMDAVNEYLATDEYKAIKKMILSLSY